MDDRQADHKPEAAGLERKVAETLEFGIMKKTDPYEAAVRRLSPRTVIRIRTEQDPIVEETGLYRQMAEEVDDRYDAYMQAARRPSDESSD